MMRRLLPWRSVTRHTHHSETTAAAVLAVSSRWASTAPPLSLLSWSVDGAGHTHHRCRRRLSLHERIPLLCSTIKEAAPDVVALQDSLPEVAEALCSFCPSHSSNGSGTPCKIRPAADTATEVAVKGPQYELIGSVRNGRCGYLQLFRRCDSAWSGRLLPHCPCLTAEFVSDVRDGNNTATARTSSGGGGGGGASFVLSNVDLSYRGKSLAVGGKSMASPAVSANGSPFTLRVGPGEATAAAAATRVKGQLDPHREAALTFVSHVARPDVLIGNFFMGRTDCVPGYDDAWVLAGAPAEHERTTNTFAHHKHDAETNFFYFVPRDTRNEVGSLVNSSTAAEVAADALLGARVPLNARRHDGDAGWSVAHAVTATPSPKKDKAGEEGATSEQEGTTPQVAGRFHRCFFRHQSSRHHKRQLPLFRRYERRQLVVLKPFTEVPLTAEEAKSHSLNNKSDNSSEGRVRCSASDSYPILVLLS
ncbi:hypothetical protein DQ04_06541030 [Trypanosoma grayi]|uniref:hypothetical protein n=1 Tax=Trypanosoma grayi TaxID=71804 RepID=UPI0004F482B3|nr:hypothetical protein DQ04_06541030 [Trypanosoma grayi]KEG08738.1 hypothetical protein DQ04_06541030 [Trypanosoma grayi]